MLISEYLKSYKGSQPIFVSVSSEDPGCGPCAKVNAQNGHLAKFYKEDYHFVLTTGEPWNKKEFFNQVETTFKVIDDESFALYAVPFSAIISKNKLIASKFGPFKDNQEVKNIFNQGLGLGK